MEQLMNGSERSVVLNWIVNRLAGCLGGIIDTGTSLIGTPLNAEGFLQWRADVFRALVTVAGEALKTPTVARNHAEAFTGGVSSKFSDLITALMSLAAEAGTHREKLEIKCREVSTSYYAIVEQISELCKLEKLTCPYDESISPARQAYYSTILANLANTISKEQENGPNAII